VHLDGDGRIMASLERQDIVCVQPVEFGKWYHIVLIVAGDRAELFKDGESCGGASGFATPMPYYDNSSYLGYLSQGFAYSAQFEGKLDNFRLSLSNKTQTDGEGYVMESYLEGLAEFTETTTTTSSVATTTIAPTTTAPMSTTTASATTTQSTIDYEAIELRIAQLESKVAALESWKATIDSWKAGLDAAISSILLRLALIEAAVFPTSTTTTTTTIATTTTTVITTIATTIPTTSVITTTTAQPSQCEGNLISTYSFTSSGKVTCPSNGYSSCCVYESCANKAVTLAPGQSYSRTCSRKWTASLYGMTSS
jgi:hypothetical protein